MIFCVTIPSTDTTKQTTAVLDNYMIVANGHCNCIGALHKNSGTSIVQFQPTFDKVTLDDGKTCVDGYMYCIPAMKEYKEKCLEELRLEDYLAKRKGRQTSFAQQSEFCLVKASLSNDSVPPKFGSGANLGPLFVKPFTATSESKNPNVTKPFAINSRNNLDAIDSNLINIKKDFVSKVPIKKLNRSARRRMRSRGKNPYVCHKPNIDSDETTRISAPKRSK